jgi:sec-independent protein translocase protein TatC
MAAPLIILYGVSILIVRMVNPASEEDDEDDETDEETKTLPEDAEK